MNLSSLSLFLFLSLYVYKAKHYHFLLLTFRYHFPIRPLPTGLAIMHDTVFLQVKLFFLMPIFWFLTIQVRYFVTGSLFYVIITLLLPWINNSVKVTLTLKICHFCYIKHAWSFMLYIYFNSKQRKLDEQNLCYCIQGTTRDSTAKP